MMTVAKRVTKPKETVTPRLKLMMFGAAGAGKTYGSMWPDSYIIDCEKGTVHYDAILSERNCARVLTTDVLEASANIKALMAEPHDYKTVVIDPITSLYEDSQEKWNNRFIDAAKKTGNAAAAEMQDFGLRYWGKVKAEQKALVALLKRIDMNVIVTAHEKAQYGDSMKVIGQTFDGLKGLDYLFDTVIRLVKDPNSENRMALTLKDRTGKFPGRFAYTYDKVLELWGVGIERKAEAVTLATPEQVTALKSLVNVIQIPDNWELECLRKADVSSWEDMEEKNIKKCIKWLTEKLPENK